MDWGTEMLYFYPAFQGVVALQATDKAFAALRSDGQVISWGGAEHGGDGPYNELTTRADAAKSGYR